MKFSKFGISKFRFGIFAEYVVAFFYIITGHVIIKHRMRNLSGEIDLIAVRGKLIIFIEVKGRGARNRFEIISDHQIGRIVRAAKLFLASNIKYSGYDARFDLATVSAFFIPHIIKNAWRE